MKILRQKDFIDSKEENYGCLMLYFSFSKWKDLIENLIKEEDIYNDDKNSFGYEYEPHCTIFYGFKHYDEIVEDIKKLLPTIEELNDNEILRGSIEVFENEEYDVVKFDVKSDKLRELNKLMEINFDNKKKFYYNPHITIAYVKKEKGSKYIRNLEDLRIFGDKYVYSDPDMNRTDITF